MAGCKGFKVSVKQWFSFILALSVAFGGVLSGPARADSGATGPCAAEWSGGLYVAPYDMEHCPADIQSWMDRVSICYHWAGEEPYDAERAAFLAAAWKKDSCAQIGCDYRTLFARYEGDIVYAGVLSQYAEAVYGSIADMPACPAE